MYQVLQTEFVLPLCEGPSTESIFCDINELIPIVQFYMFLDRGILTAKA